MGDYIALTSGKGDVHWRPDPRTPRTACGVNFTGTFATTHPIVTGGAFTCRPCQESYDQREKN